MHYQEDPDAEKALLHENQHDVTHEAVYPPQHQPPHDKSQGIAIKSLYLAGYVSAILFFIYINLKADAILPKAAYWMYSNFDLALCLAAFTWAIHKSVYNPRLQMKNLGRIMIMVMVYSTDACLLTFNLMACSRADGFNTIKHMVMFIPLLLLFAIVYCFICFIIPGFLDTENQFYKEAFLLLSYYVTGLATVIILGLKLDDTITWSYYRVFAPLFVAFGLHALLIICQFFDKTATFSTKETFFLLLSGTFVILASVALERTGKNQQTVPWGITLCPIYVLLTLGALKSLASLIKKHRNA